MDNITHYVQFDFENLEKIKNSFLDTYNFNEFEIKTNEFFDNLKANFFTNVLNSVNKAFCDDEERKKEWYINRTDKKNLTTTAGSITFNKTLFTKKDKSESKYLIDDLLGFESHKRISDNCKVKIVKEAKETSYRKAGSCINGRNSVSKTTVKNIMHKLKFPDETIKEAKNKKKVDILYIEADEDHEKLQFNKKKGDLTTSKHGRKENGLISKLIYVHEGTKKESENSKRNVLINPHYFASTCGDLENNDFWNVIDNYIQANYDIKNIKQIYLMADGGGWIKTALECIPNLIYVMDEFHLNKYLNRMCRKFNENKSVIKKQLRKFITENDAFQFKKTIEIFSYSLSNYYAEKLFEDANYILNNWNACYLRVKLKNKICGCSAEGHISHILASRMSSRPMAWSRIGANKMVNAISYIENKNSVTNLIKFQKKDKCKKNESSKNEAMKYYKPDKLKANSCFSRKETILKYADIFTTVTLPGQTQSNWLKKDVSNY